MRIFVSALLLALTGNNKKESKCLNGDELTNSFIPAGLQVSNHYVTQLRWPLEMMNPSGGVNATSSPVVPVIVITYDMNNASSAEGTKKSIKRLESLTSALSEEANAQGLAECRGFTSEVLTQLEGSSKSSSREQLSFILKKIMNGVMKNSTTKVLVKGLLSEVEDRHSQISKDLQTAQPLRYLSDFSAE